MEAIPGPDPHYLSSVDVVPGPEGQVVVGESEGFVWLGNPATEEWTQIAAPGDGPAEVGDLAGAFYLDGSIWAADRSRERILEFDTTGTLLSERRIPVRDLVTWDWAPGREAHHFLGSGPGWVPSDEIIQRPPTPVVRVSAFAIDTLFEMPNVEWFVTDQLTGGPLLRPSGHLVGQSGRFWFADNARPELILWDGSVATIVRWSVPDWDPRRAADSLLDAAIATLPSEQVTPEIEAQVRSVPLSPNPHSFWGLVPVADGGIAVGSRLPACCAQPGRRVGPWLIFRSDGTPSMVVALPEGFEPSYFGADYVLGVATDDLGREMIQERELLGRE